MACCGSRVSVPVNFFLFALFLRQSCFSIDLLLVFLRFAWLLTSQSIFASISSKNEVFYTTRKTRLIDRSITITSSLLLFPTLSCRQHSIKASISNFSAKVINSDLQTGPRTWEFAKKSVGYKTSFGLAANDLYQVRFDFSFKSASNVTAFLKCAWDYKKFSACLLLVRTIRNAVVHH